MILPLFSERKLPQRNPLLPSESPRPSTFFPKTLTLRPSPLASSLREIPKQPQWRSTTRQFDTDDDSEEDNLDLAAFATPRGPATPFMTPHTSKKNDYSFSTPDSSIEKKKKSRSRKRNEVTPKKNVSPYPPSKSTRLGKRARQSDNDTRISSDWEEF